MATILTEMGHFNCRIVHGYRNDLRPELRILIGSPDIEGQPVAILEILRQRRSARSFHTARKTLAVRRREPAALTDDLRYGERLETWIQ